MKFRIAIGILVFGALLFSAVLIPDTTTKIAAALLGGILVLVAAITLLGLKPKSLDIGVGQAKTSIQFEYLSAQNVIVQRTLDEQELVEKETYAREFQKDHALPGQDAPLFSAINLTLADDLLVRPSAYPMTPMYLLDSSFRVLDWNEAFTVAFDRTMEGRKGRGVLEWTYFLDNYEEVLAHGAKSFGSANTLPVIDVERIEYTSRRYGKLTATKRAYQIPDDTGNNCLAWLVILDLKFADLNQQSAFNRDLIGVLSLNLMWSEYAMSYDNVLNNTKVYPELLNKLVGGYDGVRVMPDDACILDLGAGTGNLAYRLASSGPNRKIIAAENNRVMLELLRTKCKRFLRSDFEGGGIIALKQDVTSLFGLDDNYFDFVISNNVLYSVQDAKACLAEAHRVLKPGGELRLSGPRRDTNLRILFERIMLELKQAKKFQEVEQDFKHIVQINEWRLRPWLYRWTTKEVEAMLTEVGFSKILHSSEDIYAGQSMFISAVK
jgi:ubiquinone/menaquinone biosynthesis C-methylase UbiE